jgi:hypothetical protein
MDEGGFLCLGGECMLAGDAKIILSQYFSFVARCIMSRIGTKKHFDIGV